MPVSFSSFSNNELINLAIDIEKRGIVFYDIMARSTENASAREVFHGLVEMEREHIQVFENMLDKDRGDAVPEDVAEYSGYLKSLIDNSVFNEESVASEMATQVNSDAAALELGISMEKDSILFYYEMRERVARPSRVTIDRIIGEEKPHLNQLAGLKRILTDARSRNTEKIPPGGGGGRFG